MWGLLDQNAMRPESFVAFFATKELAETAAIEWNYVGRAIVACEVPVMKTLEDVRNRQPHWLYAAQRVTGGPVKLGVTMNPKARLAQLNAHSLEEVVFVGVTGPLPRNDVFMWETYIKNQNQRAQVHGEWFDVTFEIVEIIEGMNRTPRAICSPLIHNLGAAE